MSWRKQEIEAETLSWILVTALLMIAIAIVGGNMLIGGRTQASKEYIAMYCGMLPYDQLKDRQIEAYVAHHKVDCATERSNLYKHAKSLSESGQ